MTNKAPPMTPKEVEDHAKKFAQTWSDDPKTLGAGLIVRIMIYLDRVLMGNLRNARRPEARKRLNALMKELDRRLPGEG